MPKKRVTTEPRGLRHYSEIGGILLLVTALFTILQKFNVLSFSLEAQAVISLSTVFVIGLVAASSTCLAVVGGLLLSVAARWAEASKKKSRSERFQPLFLFNIGRLVGYFVFGGIVGVLGTAFLMTPKLSGLFTIIIAIIMIMLGLMILQILPKKYCSMPLPSFMAKRLRALKESDHPGVPFLLGALTFFLPCGFTQSMQLLALGSGSFLAGGTIMLVFALGTLPALLGISVMSSIAEGRSARWFLRFSGAVVLVLGVHNFSSGLVLSGVNAKDLIDRAFFTPAVVEDQDPYVSINEKGQQIIVMYVSDTGYSPHTFTIDPGKETWVYAIAQTSLRGCANFLVAPSFNLMTPIKQGANWLGPIQNPTKNFVLTCSLGRLRADVMVR